ncbi:MAG TPA: FAD-dependent oxidoreductase [Brevundimonas sp.]|nr:FAD-dependent oxidoreductase [Brevundimonas sp.]
MDASQTAASGLDFSRGVPLAQIPAQGVLAGHVAGEPVLLARRADGLWAVSAVCTHYGGPLGEGLVVGDTVRCPWHHACFDLRSGEALAAPAMAPLDRWTVEVDGEQVFVRAKALPAALSAPRPVTDHPKRIVIVGGGAAGFAAAEMLRRRGYQGMLTLLSADPEPPCDRPNLSKDYLAGTAPEDWIPLKPLEFYADQAIDLRLGFEVVQLDVEAREAVGRGERVGYDALLLATGAEPIRLAAPGFDRANVHLLRSLADARAIIAAAERGRKVVIVGASFIGLEAAAALGNRGLEVHVVAPGDVPLERVMGPQIGRFVRDLHVSRGVQFHLGRTAESFDGQTVTLSDQSRLAADFVVLGVGVRPRLQLAIDAGLMVDDGVIVDRGMRTSRPGIFAAGDIARYPGRTFEASLRVEHWVVAERQGQIAAMNMLGSAAELTEAPFFWSRHYDQSIHYVGHARTWDALRIEGSVPDADATVRFEQGGRLLAAATIGRDLESLRIATELGDPA